MRSQSRRSIRSSPQNINYSRTQELKKQISNNYQWKDIIEGIDSIAFKLKEIAGKQNKNRTTNLYQSKMSQKNQAGKDRGYQSVTRFKSVGKSQSKNKGSEKGQKTVKNVCKPFINETRSCKNNRTQKIMNGTLTSTASCNQSINKEIENHNSKTLSLTKYRQTLKQNTQLRQLNSSLLNKNEELKKQLFEEQIRVKNVKVHEIVLKLFDENDFHDSVPTKSTQQSQQGDKTFLTSTKPLQNKLENMNDLVKLSPIKKKKNELMVPQKRKFLDLSKTQSKIQKSNEEVSPKKQQPNKILSLQTQFDRLMQLSHKQNNKARKRVIRDEMKVLAKELKQMRYITNN